MSWVIRPAEIAECDVIARIFRDTRKISLPFLPVLHTAEEDRAFIRGKLFPDCEIWVAEKNEIVGFIAIGFFRVEHLYIHPEFQRRGIGTALLTKAMEKYPELSLATFQKNQAAIAFYESRGFTLARQTDGGLNEEKEPDAWYVWNSPERRSPPKNAPDRFNE